MMKWELHSHTDQSSKCGHVDAAESVRMHLSAGYNGLVITDHYNNMNIECYEGTPDDQARQWMHGYEVAKAAGDELGLCVLFGLEARLQDCDNDYLIIGAEPNFVLENPTLNHLTIEELHALCRKYNALLIQAHPNRKGCHPVDPKNLDGVEVFNSNPRHDSFDALTQALADENPHLIKTAGSDFHRPEDLDGACIMTEDGICTSAALAEALRTGNYKIVPENYREIKNTVVEKK